MSRQRIHPIGAVTVMALATGLVVLAPSHAPTSSAAGSSAAPSVLGDGSPWTSTTGPFLPTVIPADVPSGTIETPIGTVRWAHLAGDPDTLPWMWQMLPGPDGLLLLDDGGWHPCQTIPTGRHLDDVDGDGTCEQRASLWHSRDALEWTEIPIPVEGSGARLDLVDDTYWLGPWSPGGLWRSVDARTWEAIDLSAVKPTGPGTLTWEATLDGPPVGSNDRVVLPVTLTAVDGAALLGYPEHGPHARPELVSPGLYSVLDGYDRGIGFVRIEETSSGLAFRDASGGIIAELAGVGLGFIEAWSERRSIVEQAVVVVDAGVSSASSVPAPAGPGSGGWSDVALIATPDGFRAFVVDEEHGQLRSWRSSDGLAWDVADAVTFEEPVFAVGSTVDPDGVPVLYATAGDINGELRSWRSRDGTTWEAQDEPGRPFGTGLIRFQNTGDGVELFTLADGGAWTPLLIKGLTDPIRGDDGSRFGVVGDTAVVMVGWNDGLTNRHLWIVELDPRS